MALPVFQYYDNTGTLHSVSDMTVYDPLVNPVHITDALSWNGTAWVPVFTAAKTLNYDAPTYENVNILNDYIAKWGQAPLGPVRLTINIGLGVTIGSSSIASPALTIGAFPANSSITLINDGAILGLGGNGGVGGSVVSLLTDSANLGTSGGSGGPAMDTSGTTITIINNGLIAGGGGGGSGNGCRPMMVPIPNASGSYWISYTGAGITGTLAFALEGGTGGGGGAPYGQGGQSGSNGVSVGSSGTNASLSSRGLEGSMDFINSSKFPYLETSGGFVANPCYEPLAKIRRGRIQSDLETASHDFGNGGYYGLPGKDGILPKQLSLPGHYYQPSPVIMGGNGGVAVLNESSATFSTLGNVIGANIGGFQVWYRGDYSYNFPPQVVGNSAATIDLPVSLFANCTVGELVLVSITAIDLPAILPTITPPAGFTQLGVANIVQNQSKGNILANPHMATWWFYSTIGTLITSDLLFTVSANTDNVNTTVAMTRVLGIESAYHDSSVPPIMASTSLCNAGVVDEVLNAPTATGGWGRFDTHWIAVDSLCYPTTGDLTVFNGNSSSMNLSRRHILHISDGTIGPAIGNNDCVEDISIYPIRTSSWGDPAPRILEGWSSLLSVIIGVKGTS